MAERVLFVVSGNVPGKDGLIPVRQPFSTEFLEAYDRGTASRRATRPPDDARRTAAHEAWERTPYDDDDVIIKSAWRNMVGPGLDLDESFSDEENVIEPGAVRPTSDRNAFFLAAERYAFTGAFDHLIGLMRGVYVTGPDNTRVTMRECFALVVTHQRLRFGAIRARNFASAKAHSTHVRFFIQVMINLCVAWIATGVNFTSDMVRSRHVGQGTTPVRTDTPPARAPLSISDIEAVALVNVVLGSEVAKDVTIVGGEIRIPAETLDAISNAAVDVPPGSYEAAEASPASVSPVHEAYAPLFGTMINGVAGFPGTKSSLFGILLREADAAARTVDCIDASPGGAGLERAGSLNETLKRSYVDYTADGIEASATAWPILEAFREIVEPGRLLTTQATVETTPLTDAFAVAVSRSFVDWWRDVYRWELSGTTLVVSDRHKLVGLEYAARDLCASVSPEDLAIACSAVGECRRAFSGRGSSIAEMGTARNRISYEHLLVAAAGSSDSDASHRRTAFAKWFFNTPGIFVWGEQIAETAYLSGSAPDWSTPRRQTKTSVKSTIARFKAQTPAYSAGASFGRIAGLESNANLARAEVNYLRLMDYRDAGAKLAGVLATFRRYYFATCPHEAAALGLIADYARPSQGAPGTLAGYLAGHLLNPSVGSQLRAGREAALRRTRQAATLIPSVPRPDASAFPDLDAIAILMDGISSDEEEGPGEEEVGDSFLSGEGTDTAGESSIFDSAVRILDEAESVSPISPILPGGTSSEGAATGTSSSSDMSFSPMDVDGGELGQVIAGEDAAEDTSLDAPAPYPFSPGTPMNIDQGTVSTPEFSGPAAVQDTTMDSLLVPLSPGDEITGGDYLTDMSFMEDTTESSGMSFSELDQISDPEDTPPPPPRPTVFVVPGERPPAASRFVLPQPTTTVAPQRPPLAARFAVPGSSTFHGVEGRPHMPAPEPLTPTTTVAPQRPPLAARFAVPGSSAFHGVEAYPRTPVPELPGSISMASISSSDAGESDYSLTSALNNSAFDISIDSPSSMHNPYFSPLNSSVEVSPAEKRRREEYAERMARINARRLGIAVEELDSYSLLSSPSSSGGLDSSAELSPAEKLYREEYADQVKLDIARRRDATLEELYAYSPDSTPSPSGGLDSSAELSPAEKLYREEYADQVHRHIARRLGISLEEVESYSPPPTPFSSGGLDSSAELSPAEKLYREEYADQVSRSIARKLGISAEEFESYSPLPTPFPHGDSGSSASPLSFPFARIGSSDDSPSPLGGASTPLSSASPRFPVPSNPFDMDDSSRSMTPLGGGRTDRSGRTTSRPAATADPQPFGSVAIFGISLSSFEKYYGTVEADSLLVTDAVKHSRPIGLPSVAASVDWDDTYSSESSDSLDDAMTAEELARRMAVIPARPQNLDLTPSVTSYQKRDLDVFREGIVSFADTVQSWKYRMEEITRRGGDPTANDHFAAINALHTYELGNGIARALRLLVSVYDVSEDVSKRAEAVYGHIPAVRSIPGDKTVIDLSNDATTARRAPIFAFQTTSAFDGRLAYAVIPENHLLDFLNLIEIFRKAIGVMVPDEVVDFTPAAAFLMTQYIYTANQLQSVADSQLALEREPRGSPEMTAPPIHPVYLQYMRMLARVVDDVKASKRVMRDLAEKTSVMPRY